MIQNIFTIIVPPLALLLMEHIIVTDDYQFDVTGWERFISQNGVNLQFWKFNEKQWEVLTKQLAPRYFLIAGVMNLCLNILIVICVKDRDLMMSLVLLFYLLILLGTLLLIKIKLNKYKSS